MKETFYLSKFFTVYTVVLLPTVWASVFYKKDRISLILLSDYCPVHMLMKGS